MIAVRGAGDAEVEAHPHLGPARGALDDGKTVGDLSDEREADAEPGAVGIRLKAVAIVPISTQSSLPTIQAAT